MKIFGSRSGFHRLAVAAFLHRFTNIAGSACWCQPFSKKILAVEPIGVRANRIDGYLSPIGKHDRWWVVTGFWS